MMRKFIMVVNNQMRFNDFDYSEDRIIRESALTWIPISSMVRTYIGYKLQITDIDVQDHILGNFGQWTDGQESIFAFK